MPKKKKKRGQNDARGYAISNMVSKKASASSSKSASASSANNKRSSFQNSTKTSNHNKIGGKSVKKVQVSQSAQKELASLLDELRSSLASGEGEELQKQQQQQPIHFDVGDKRMVKKIVSLNDTLQGLGFSEEHIKAAFVAILSGQGNSHNQIQGLASTSTNKDNTYDNDPDPSSISNALSIESLLDWLCIHLSTEELPKLFTDTDPLSEVGVGADQKLSKITFERDRDGDNSNEMISGGNSMSERKMDVWDVNTNISPAMGNLKMDEGVGAIAGVGTNANRQTSNDDKKESNDDAETNAQRNWILQQYQYEDEEDIANGENEKGGNDTSENVDTAMEEKSIEEMRLERLEKQIKEDRASLNDEASNYMRSKYEIADLKKQLKKAEQQAKGLRAKIAKKKAKEREAQEKEQEENDGGVGAKDGDEATEEDYSGGMFDLFAPAPAGNVVEPAEDENVKTVHVPDLLADIPSGWTGKLPKDVLIEHCRRKKWTRPTFSKMKETRNGCVVKIRLSRNNEKVVEHKGPFASFKDAEHFASTQALYELDPQLPSYQLLPPTFRDLFKGYINEDARERLTEEARVDEERDVQIMALIQSIQDALPKRKKEAVALDDTKKEETEEAKDWDDLSWESDNNDDEEAPEEITSLGAKITPLGTRLKDAFQKKESEVGYRNMKKVRSTLPMFSYRQQFLETVKQNAVTVLCAETGAGKTTQCPQFLLEDALSSGFGDRTNILCTQPRRISALSVAERVAEEMDEKIGGTVGYQIRMEAKRSKATRLMFCTTGVVLRRLQDDPDLKGVSCVCVDECHERQWQIDFLLIALRRLLQTTRKDLKVVLMSATIDSKLFCSFFEGAPFLSIPGRTFPVSQYYLEDVLEATGYVVEEDSRYALRSRRGDNTASLFVGRGEDKRRQVVSLESELESIEVSDLYEGYTMPTRRSMEIVDEQVINYELLEDLLTLILVDSNNNDSLLPPEGADGDQIENGSILIFLPGIGEIKTLHDILKSNINFGDDRRFDLIPMHSTLSPKDQKRAFMTPKKGCRKIILATNIAETSVTIADCVCVIDTGLERQVVQNKRSNTSTLVTTWCSRASAKQRAGRAGRVRPGLCCKMYSSKTANVVMSKQSTPELQRVPLEEVCLSILAGKLSDNCMDFLLQAPQPPSQESVSNALKVLEETGAINPISAKNVGSRREIITPLGSHLAKLPVSVKLGKMLIFGSLFGVLDVVLTIVASLSASRSPFIANIDNSQQISSAHRAFRHPTNDFLTMYNAWNGYIQSVDVSSSNAWRFCKKNYLNRTSFIEISDMRRQFFQLLSSIGFIDETQVKTVDELIASRYNENSDKEEVLNAAICAGLYPNIAHIVKEPGDAAYNLFHKSEKLWFHKSSTNHDIQTGGITTKEFNSEWVVFQEKFATSKTYVSTTSLIKPFSLLLFGESIVVRHVERKVTVDGWIELNTPAQIGVMFRELRCALSKVIQERMDRSKASDERAGKIINGICKLIAIE